ncbi:hypothetical protein [Mycolicibacterium baixiangningiae]|uniref:hypothetical protein n=1 Tax=Mycolicibacterium baixiangningiae TaxID=2761578 RepID=UPI001868A66C|nr:hypothetical protein [Mycolicibacterium baixiangningiae]
MNTANDFTEEVQSVVGPLLSDLGFTLDSANVDVDEGGRFGSVVYYVSADCRIQIYQSSREGSVNCMIAPLDARNEFGPRDKSSKWQYLTRFSPMPDVPLEVLIEAVSFDPKTTAEELHWVRDNILKYYETAHAGILEAYGNP